MSAEIYYFSGTGNSLFVARELQKRIPDSRIIPMVSLLDQAVIHMKGRTVGLVFPVHALTIPIAVKRFIEKADLGSAEYVFAVATRLGTVFRGFQKMDQLLRKKKKQLNAHFVLNMCNNECRHEGYVVPSEADIRSLESVVLEKLDSIWEIVKQKITSREKDLEYKTEYHSHHPIINYFLEKLVLSGMAVSEHIGGVNYFYRDSKCRGCGICGKVCLSGKIKMEDQKPVWQKNIFCYMCFACLNYCPEQSVQIEDIPGVKSFSRENGRYPHPYATVKDIAEQKMGSSS